MARSSSRHPRNACDVAGGRRQRQVATARRLVGGAALLAAVPPVAPPGRDPRHLSGRLLQLSRHHGSVTLKISLVACVANAIFNPILMFGAGMGMAAALATSISQLIAGGCYFVCCSGTSSSAGRRRSAHRARRCSPSSRRRASGSGAQRRPQLGLCCDHANDADSRHVGRFRRSWRDDLLWQLGGVVLFAMGSVATILTSAELGQRTSAAGGAARPPQER